MLKSAITLAPALLISGTTGIGFADAQPTAYFGQGTPVVGSGRIVTQARPTRAFVAVELRGAAEVTVRVGSASSVSVTADDNLQPLLRTEVRHGGLLVLDSSRSYQTRQTPRITITVPRLTAFAVEGSGDAKISGINGGSLALAVSGSGDIQAQGRTRDLAIAVSGAGDIDAGELASNSAAVVISGSGDAVVRTSGALTGVVRGSGDVRYIGKPRTVTVQVGGSGSVERAR
jgi:hypothetical protein